MKKKKLLLIALSLMAGSAFSGRRANDKSGIRIVNGRKLYFKK